MRRLSILLAFVSLLCLSPMLFAKTYTLVGATMLPKEHQYGRTIDKFAELVSKYYDGDLNVRTHYNGDLGTEKDMYEYMIQGISVDFAVIAPEWITTWVKSAAIISAPFVFEDVEHWQRSIKGGAFDSVAEESKKKGVRVIGYGGGSSRNIILNKPIKNENDIRKIKLRVQGSTLHQKVFTGIGFKAIPLDFMEVYNAINTGVLDGLENEPGGYYNMKFYEVAPYYILSEHQVVTRMLVFSERSFKRLPKELQSAVIKAGSDASAYHVQIETSEAKEIVKDLEENYGVTVTEYDNTEMREKAMPIIESYAKSIGASEILEQIKTFE